MKNFDEKKSDEKILWEKPVVKNLDSGISDVAVAFSPGSDGSTGTSTSSS